MATRKNIELEFLSMSFEDLLKHCRPITANELEKIEELVKDVEVDPDETLPGDDDLVLPAFPTRHS